LGAFGPLFPSCIDGPSWRGNHRRRARSPRDCARSHPWPTDALPSWRLSKWSPTLPASITFARSGRIPAFGGRSFPARSAARLNLPLAPLPPGWPVCRTPPPHSTSPPNPHPPLPFPASGFARAGRIWSRLRRVWTSGRSRLGFPIVLTIRRSSSDLSSRPSVFPTFGQDMPSACPPLPAIAFSASGRSLSAESAEATLPAKEAPASRCHSLCHRAPVPLFPALLPGRPSRPALAVLALLASSPACSWLNARFRLSLGRAWPRSPALNGPCPRWAARADFDPARAGCEVWEPVGSPQRYAVAPRRASPCALATLARLFQ
jgi:hypothetical protein